MSHDTDKKAVITDDEAELARLGYKQELKRDWSLLQNFGVSFSIISVITGISTLFLYGLTTGGPAVMSISWIIVAFFTLIVGLAMAEICSSIPTSGGPYFWSAMLASPGQSAIAAWITGWFNLLGQVAVTTGISYGCSNFIATTATLHTGFEPNSRHVIGIYAGVLVTQGLINTFGVHLLKYLNNASVVFHSAGIFSIAVAVLAKAPKLQSASFVFGKFVDATGVGEDGVGWGKRASKAYVAVIGILVAQYTMTGFDASAHLSEETHNAALRAPQGIIISILCSAVFGWFLLLSLLFSIQNLDGVLNSATGQPVAQIYIDAVGTNGAIAMLTVTIICMYLCGTFSITSNSRMMYAFSRDGALPLSRFWHHVDEKRKSPIRTVWLAVLLSFCLGLPSLGSAVAFSAATSIATSGLYISYVIPVAFRMIERKNFKKGPFHLGRMSMPVAFVAIAWVCFITIVFVLPELNPITSQTLNYTPVACGAILVGSLIWWFLDARKWFKGPIRQIEAERLGIDITEPGALEKAEREGRLGKEDSVSEEKAA
ncbi:APC amino acid permease [Atractiella rhizophila]|nr:APC amino acid permease [Atractiella rhizophila]